MTAKSNNRVRRSGALTRRTMLVGAAVSPLVPGVVTPDDPADPVLILWQEWLEAHAKAEALRCKWQKLETLLFRTVGFPRVSVPAPEDLSPMFVIDHDQIDERLGTGAETAALRERLHAELTCCNSRWNAAAASVHFDAVEAQYDAADARADALSDTIFKTPADSIEGVAAKLALVLAIGQPSPQDDQFPWPHLRGVLADVRRWPLFRPGAGKTANPWRQWRTIIYLTSSYFVVAVAECRIEARRHFNAASFC